MNTIAYLVIHGAGIPVALAWLLNILIAVIVAVIVFLILQWLLSLLGVPARIIQLIGALVALLIFCSLFVGCAAVKDYQSTVDSRRVAVGYNGDGTIGFSDKVVYRQSP